MPEPTRVSCPNCGAELTREETAKVGRRVPCPKCSLPFVIPRPDDDDEDVDFVEIDEACADEPPRPRRERAARAGSTGSETHARTAGSGNHFALMAVGVAASFLFVAGMIWAVSTLLSHGGDIAAKPASGPAGDAASIAAVSQTGVTDAACEELGRRLEAAFMTKQVQSVSTHFDWNAFAGLALTGLDVSAAEKAGFTRGFTGAVESPNGFLGSITTRMGTGSVKFIRVRTTPSGKRILLRTLFEDGTTNYIEWVPVQNEAGQLKIVDGYVYISGELLSTTIRRVTVPMLAGKQPTLLQRMSGAEREGVKYIQHVQRMTTALQSGQYQQVLALYEQLPESLKQEKAVLLQCLMAAQNVGDAEYLTVMETFQKQFPGDVALDFIRLDYLTLKNDLQGVIEALRRLEAAMGGDAYLHSLMALQLLQLGRLPEARLAAEESMRLEPALAMPYQVLVPVSLREQRFEESLRLMKLLFEKTTMEFTDMATDPDFAGFIQSPEYAEWQTYRQQQN